MLAATQSLICQPGTSQTSTLLSAAPDLASNLTWRLINDADGTAVIAESSDSIVEIDTGQDAPNSRYDRVFTAPASAGRYLAVWRYDTEEVAQTIVVASSPSVAFATASDVSSRLGRSLSTRETSDVPFLLNMAAVTIADAAGYDDGWAVTLGPVPQMLRKLSVELVCRALKNPGQYSQVRQQVGSYSFQASWDNPGMNLSPAEELMVRRAVHGRTTDSMPVDSSFKPAQDEYWLRKQSVRYSDPGDPAEVIR